VLSSEIISQLDTFLSVHPTGTIVVYGPTACGKTAMSIDIAKYCNSEIVSADARQIYTGLDIGTGKITPEEMQNIPHYMIDVCSVEDEFSVYTYRDMATTYIENIRNKGKPPILCGGTGLYIDSVVYARSYIQIPVDTALRTELEDIRIQQGNTALWNRLHAIDPVYARTLHPNNYQYVMRGIEVYIQSGKSKMDIVDEKKLLAPTLFLTPYTDNPTNRDILYTHIDERVENMFKI
jgi:tRNA dimethylallyltransferase